MASIADRYISGPISIPQSVIPSQLPLTSNGVESGQEVQAQGEQIREVQTQEVQTNQSAETEQKASLAKIALAAYEVIKKVGAFLVSIPNCKLVQFFKKHKVVDLTSAAIKMVTNCYKTLGNSKMGIVKRIMDAVKPYFDVADLIDKMAAVSKLIAVGCAPLYLYGIFEGFKRMIVKFHDGAKFVDGALTTIQNISSTAGSVSSTAEFLNTVGLVAESAIQWTKVIPVVSLVLSAASLIATAKGWYVSRKFINEAQQNLKDNKMNYEAALKKMAQMKGLKKQLDLKRGEFTEKIDSLAVRMKKFDPAKRNKVFKKYYEEIIGHVEHKIDMNKISLAGSIIGSVGSILAMAFVPLTPLAYIMIAASAGVGIVKLQSAKSEKARFEQLFNE